MSDHFVDPLTSVKFPITLPNAYLLCGTGSNDFFTVGMYIPRDTDDLIHVMQLHLPQLCPQFDPIVLLQNIDIIQRLIISSSVPCTFLFTITKETDYTDFLAFFEVQILAQHLSSIPSSSNVEEQSLSRKGMNIPLTQTIRQNLAHFLSLFPSQLSPGDRILVNIDSYGVIMVESDVPHPDHSSFRQSSSNLHIHSLPSSYVISETPFQDHDLLRQPSSVITVQPFEDSQMNFNSNRIKSDILSKNIKSFLVSPTSSCLHSIEESMATTTPAASSPTSGIASRKATAPHKGRNDTNRNNQDTTKHSGNHLSHRSHHNDDDDDEDETNIDQLPHALVQRLHLVLREQWALYHPTSLPGDTIHDDTDSISTSSSRSNTNTLPSSKAIPITPLKTSLPQQSRNSTMVQHSPVIAGMTLSANTRHDYEGTASSLTPSHVVWDNPHEDSSSRSAIQNTVCSLDGGQDVVISIPLSFQSSSIGGKNDHQHHNHHHDHHQQHHYPSPRGGGIRPRNASTSTSQSHHGPFHFQQDTHHSHHQDVSELSMDPFQTADPTRSMWTATTAPSASVDHSPGKSNQPSSVRVNSDGEHTQPQQPQQSQQSHQPRNSPHTPHVQPSQLTPPSQPTSRPSTAPELPSSVAQGASPSPELSIPMSNVDLEATSQHSNAQSTDNVVIPQEQLSKIAYKEGYLYYNRPGLLGSRWKPRFFSAYGKMLSCADTKESEPLIILDLSQCKIFVDPNKRIVKNDELPLLNHTEPVPVLTTHVVFTVYCRQTKRRFELSAGPQTATTWLRHLVSIILATRPTARLSTFSSLPSAVGEDGATAVMSTGASSGGGDIQPSPMHSEQLFPTSTSILTPLSTVNPLQRTQTPPEPLRTYSTIPDVLPQQIINLINHKSDSHVDAHTEVPEPYYTRPTAGNAVGSTLTQPQFTKHHSADSIGSSGAVLSSKGMDKSLPDEQKSAPPTAAATQVKKLPYSTLKSIPTYLLNPIQKAWLQEYEEDERKQRRLERVSRLKSLAKEDSPVPRLQFTLQHVLAIILFIVTQFAFVYIYNR